ncbi:TetR/AcrR family transcriptional regulator [Klebsiella variicola]|uniref:TetR/AcrR family transcriptional regulator n=1 Tax=Klebsiella variicola TaxID=244366 RepID=UPI001C22D129|nr:TetR/AcrR family transcriptional regulator [Klebsiella variicola]MBU9731524.1 TetR/AcrR family transcriptional regulator [Klebsiella variicola]
MARPRSENKRKLILHAAVQTIAEAGLDATTQSIARRAGVAQGTVFTYFTNKDDLLNQLYLELKSQLRLTLAHSDEPKTLRDRVWMAWQAYVSWGVNHPSEHAVLAKLGLSSRISNETRNEGSRAFCDVSDLLEKARAGGALSNQPVEFTAAVMGGMGDITISFMRSAPATAEKTCLDGFNAFWNAVTKT